MKLLKLLLFALALTASSVSAQSAQPVSQRPEPQNRTFVSQAVENEIERICASLTNPKLQRMFRNCYPNTLDTTVHYRTDENGLPDTYIYTGDIPAMWLRDSGAQVWPYVRLAASDEQLRLMIAGVIRRQFKLINIDPYANAFNDGPTGEGEDVGYPGNHQNPWVFERKWEIDSHCYPVRLAYEYWKTTGDTSVFDGEWISAARNMVKTFREQQRKDGIGDYTFLRVTDRQLDTKCHVGRGNPVKPVGLIASAFRPSDDAVTFEFLVPSNFMAVTSLRKAAEILATVNGEQTLADECTALADEVADALQKYAVVVHPEYGKIYAFEVDGYGNLLMMDDANVPSLLGMPYLGDVERNDPIYENTRRFVWSDANPWFWKGEAGEGIGGPHIGVEMIWPMSIMMKAFTATDDNEIRECIVQILKTDAGKEFMHESFSRHDASNFTREWFAWQNTLFGELIIKLVDEGKSYLLNAPEEVDVMTFNMRYDRPDEGDNNWLVRRNRIEKVVAGNSPDIIGTQELLHNQYTYLRSTLKGYKSVGVARDDGNEEGEYNAIFFKHSRFELLDSGTFWLSQTPDKAGSMGWDGACKRIATWAVLKDRIDGSEYLAVNTHLDHVGKIARREGILLLSSRIESLAAGRPVILTGDFNSTPDSEPIKLLLSGGKLSHARDIAAKAAGPKWSFTDFGNIPEKKRTLIDYIFTSGFDVKSYEVLPYTLEGGCVSDHAPVIAKIEKK